MQYEQQMIEVLTNPTVGFINSGQGFERRELPPICATVEEAKARLAKRREGLLAEAEAQQ
jgi:hypothetical protein